MDISMARPSQIVPKRWGLHFDAPYSVGTVEKPHDVVYLDSKSNGQCWGSDFDAMGTDKSMAPSPNVSESVALSPTRLEALPTMVETCKNAHVEALQNHRLYRLPVASVASSWYHR